MGAAKFECQKNEARPSSNVRKTKHGPIRMSGRSGRRCSNVRKTRRDQVLMSENADACVGEDCGAVGGCGRGDGKAMEKCEGQKYRGDLDRMSGI